MSISTNTLAQNIPRYKLIFFTPPHPLEKIKAALFAVGAGTHINSKYTHCAFESPGTNQFLPIADKGAKPYTGSLGKIEKVEEVRVEMLCCGEEVVRNAVKVLKRYIPICLKTIL